MNVAEWKEAFEIFFSEVPSFEKRGYPRLKWTERHENIVRMRYGIEQEAKTIEEIGQYYAVTNERIKHLLNQAKRMRNHYEAAKAKDEATLARRARLADEIRKALV